jgi:hypothetical protein
LIALHVSSDIIAHHQELLNCIFTASGDTYVRHCLPAEEEEEEERRRRMCSIHVMSADPKFIFLTLQTD